MASPLTHSPANLPFCTRKIAMALHYPGQIVKVKPPSGVRVVPVM